MRLHPAWRVAALAVALSAGCYDSHFVLADGDWDVVRRAEDVRGDVRDRSGDGDADADVLAEADVHVAWCGDGRLDPGEECDDGNIDDTDACLSDCRDARCGDGVVWAGVEECDGGAVESCTSACGTMGTRSCTGACSFGFCEPPRETCDGMDDDCDTEVDEGCGGADADADGDACACACATGVPYRDGSFRFLVGDDPPADWASPAFDDGDWPVAGGRIGEEGGGCGLSYASRWPLDSRVFVRQRFDVPDCCPDPRATFGFLIDNDLEEVYLNGDSILDSAFVHEGCAWEDSLVLDDRARLRPGSNVLAVHALDRGGESSYDHRVTVTTSACP
jgi:cysteine-rich repeat protein